jgi:hypothetical protein
VPRSDIGHLAQQWYNARDGCTAAGWSHSVNTKNWHRKRTDLWAEFSNEMPFGRKNLLRGFGEDACGRQYPIIRQKDCLRFKKEVFENA